jgi:hypothetical protein
MLDLYVELRRIVEALDSAGVTYALAGGLAVSIYSAPRATEDIDLVLARPELARALDALKPLGFAGAGRPMPVAAGRLEIQRVIKMAGSDVLPVDLLLPIDPGLGRALEDRTPLDWEGRRIWVVSLASLREMKRLRNSPQDRADLEALGPETA